MRPFLSFCIKTASTAFLAVQKSAGGTPRKLPALRAEVDAPAQISAGAFSCFSSSQAPHRPFPPWRAKNHSFRCSSSPHRTRFAGLRWGPVCATLWPVSAWPLLITAWYIFPLPGPCIPRPLTTGHTRANTAFYGVGGVWYHPPHKRATRGLITRNGGGHAVGSADPTCAGPPPASTPRGILPRVPSKSAQLV